MKLKQYVVKKTYLKKITLKGKLGGYKSDEHSAEVTMTFEGDIDTKKANDQVREKANELMDDDPDWIKDDSYLRKGGD